MLKYPLEISIKAKNYKCFGNESQGFDVIQPINLIIGRNNSGKSALIDLIKFLVTPYDLSVYGHNKKHAPEVFFTTKLTLADIKQAFNSSVTVGNLGNLFNYGSINFLGHDITIKVSVDSEGHPKRHFVSVDEDNLLTELDNFSSQYNCKNNLVQNLHIPLNGKLFRKISAERDINPEAENQTLQLTSTGAGATNIIQTWLNHHNKNATLIEKDLLEKLNGIFEPDGSFQRILVKKIPHTGAWEIYLEEENKGLVSLSDSGSGLKTILLVLLHTIVMPKQEASDLNRYVFAFEELENNLHPALLRRLLTYITDLQKDSGCCVVLTTHSNVTIDFFSKNEDSQIIHVRNDGTCATAKRALGYSDSVNILNDLDVRASDILQSNGIIWVEGPSDRIYIKKWIDLWSGGILEENIHYQCLFYGGRLLSHLSAADPEEVEGAISILKANRNAILLMDSDKSNAKEELNSTKKRVIGEIQKIGGMDWVTKGREVENYLPLEALRKLYNNNGLAGPKHFSKLPDYLKKQKLETAQQFDKVSFAEKISNLLTKPELERVLDLEEKMKEVCLRIRTWNGL
jgi:putative ATP-dependent endonuclease of OLD family